MREILFCPIINWLQQNIHHMEWTSIDLFLFICYFAMEASWAPWKNVGVLTEKLNQCAEIIIELISDELHQKTEIPLLRTPPEGWILELKEIPTQSSGVFRWVTQMNGDCWWSPCTFWYSYNDFPQSSAQINVSEHIHCLN